MDKDAIRKTAVMRYEEGDYIVESPLSNRVTGAGDSPEEAWEIFSEILDETYQDWKKGKLAGYETAGRPKKNKIHTHTKIDPDIRKAMDEFAKKVGCSTGEIIEYLWMFHHSCEGIEPIQIMNLHKKSV